MNLKQLSWLFIPLLSLILSACSDDAPEQESPESLSLITPLVSAPLDTNKIVNRIAFGSCLQQDRDQTIWNTISATKPDAFLFVGDNVYGDNKSGGEGLPELIEAYSKLALSEPFEKLRADVPVLAVWDDHDYGNNDEGASFAKKELAEAIFEKTWAVPQNDARRQRPGVYFSRTIGQAGKHVQIIMLDTRFFKSEYKETDEKGAKGKERYVPDFDKTKTILGDEQWRWLEEQLQQPADLRIVVSSIQVIAEGHGWEAWRALPHEQQRLLELINQYSQDDIVLLSGDRHAAGIYKRSFKANKSLYEITSSSLNLPLRSNNVEDGPHRLGDLYGDANFGLLDIDWTTKQISLKVISEKGATVREQLVQF